MIDFLFLVVACVLFVLIGIVGIPYTAAYYIRNEKTKKRTYSYRIAFGIDCLACISMGEFFEAILCKKRGLSSFGLNTSISACIGESIVLGNFKDEFEWFNRFLDFMFQEKNHCINAYMKEIL